MSGPHRRRDRVPTRTRDGGPNSGLRRAGGRTARRRRRPPAGGRGAPHRFVPAVVDLLLPDRGTRPARRGWCWGTARCSDGGASGELAVIRTYPVRVSEYVAGVLLARTVALVAVVGVPYAVVGRCRVWLTVAPDTGIFATHAGIDSPVLYLRFLASSSCCAAYVSLAAAVSALAASRRSAIALGVPRAGRGRARR